MEFHRVLKEKRKEFGLTQEELAEKLQVSRSAISNWEIGRNYPDIQTLISLAKTFDVSLDYLLNEDLEIAKSLDLDIKKKKQFKLATIYLSLLLLFASLFAGYLWLTRDPSIEYVKETISSDTEIVPFRKGEIKNAYIEDQTLLIVLDTPTQIVGYYVEMSDNELSVNLYKQKDTSEEKGIPFDGVIRIDLKEYSKVKNIKISYE
ncbi:MULTISPECIES: helix-turn-helix domain-containing protein [unclassified Enterococcus]|uniref:helix-turn-helix domain-containing protein n=2 Tax=Enterococcus TaxID=1350 RepID=UPI001A9AFD57|nr:helix-turn-helix transcriptional regulator [Enterococcus sp. DIV1271a]MBO1299657.1 helix-turn-helix transcriptional regulator [Enterococcus sp. DIV1271a]